MINRVYFSDILNDEIGYISLFAQGQIGPIYLIEAEKRRYLLKTCSPSERLIIEAKMLEDMRQHDIAVPTVHDVSQSYLLMTYIEEEEMNEQNREVMAAEAIAALHSVSNDARMYGYWYDTTIASFTQHNEQTQYNWGLFLGQMRIMPMAEICYNRGYLDRATLQRLERLSRDIYKLIDMSQITPSLLHGDLWSGNILFAHYGAVLIDPAIYFGDREMDLAFLRMFDTFGDTFWETYERMHPLSDDFETVKAPLYQLYPILVHIALYGEQYRGHLEKNLRILKQ